MMNLSIDVSLVIACYNSASYLEEKVDEIERIMQLSQYTREYIFVEDKSTDTTAYVVKHLLKKYPQSKAIFHDKNYGRGKAISDGIKIASGKSVGFLDIDLSTSPIYIPLFVSKILAQHADVICALRIYRISPAIIHRWIASRGYHYLVYLFLKLPWDTETGFKFFRREKILPILEDITDQHWFWDTEIMYYSHIRGLVIQEIPTLFVRDTSIQSTVRLFQDSLLYFVKLVRFTFS